jgi:hypothetical protein
MSIKKSLRFEAMRDGIEDYEILELVKGIDANKADLLVKNLITSADDYTTELSKYRAMRQLALRISSGEQNVVVPLPEDTSVVDGMYNENHQSISYTGIWERNTGRPYNDYKNDAYFTTELDAYVEFSFLGTGIEFITEKYSDMGNYEIILDGVSQGTVNSYVSGARETQVSTFVKHGLTYGNHTIKVINKDQGKYMLVDAFKVID